MSIAEGRGTFTFKSEACFIVRAKSRKNDKPPVYMISPMRWALEPWQAAVYHDFDAAVETISLLRAEDAIFDACTLYGACVEYNQARNKQIP